MPAHAPWHAIAGHSPQPDSAALPYPHYPHAHHRRRRWVRTSLPAYLESPTDTQSPPPPATLAFGPMGVSYVRLHGAGLEQAAPPVWCPDSVWGNTFSQRVVGLASYHFTAAAVDDTGERDAVVRMLLYFTLHSYTHLLSDHDGGACHALFV